MPLATELAGRVAAMRFEQLPAEAVHWGKVGVLDLLGVTLAGQREPCAQLLARVAASPGPALLFGSGRRVQPLDAALINGSASHALDFDDCSDTLGGHPSAQVLTALFALADTHDASGRDLLTAYVAGFETEARLARAVNFHHYEKGWHPTATLGVFGAASACAHLLRLPREQIAVALAISASLSAGLKANFGTMTKPLHVGHAARSGLLAARLAQEGYTASEGVFEHKQGFFNVFDGFENVRPERVLQRWADPLEIVQPGIAIKQYPCCGSTHPAIDAAIELATEHEITPEMIAHVDCWTHPRRLNHTNRPNPRSNLDAKFSVQYCVATGLVRRRVVLADFEGEAYRDPAVRAIMRRLQAAPHPDMDATSTEHFGAEVRLLLQDGRVLSASTDRPLGRGPGKPLPMPRLEAKFLDCAGRVLDAGTARRVLELVWRLDELEQVSELSRALGAPPLTH